MAHIVISKQRAMHNTFFKDVISSENIPEFNGYNTNLCRLAELSVSPRNKAVCMPLIDIPPADLSTMMTTLVEANRLTSAEAGQEFTIFTCDHQLYIVSFKVIWWHAYAYDLGWCSANGRKWPG